MKSGHKLLDFTQEKVLEKGPIPEKEFVKKSSESYEKTAKNGEKRILVDSLISVPENMSNPLEKSYFIRRKIRLFEPEKVSSDVIGQVAQEDDMIGQFHMPEPALEHQVPFKLTNSKLGKSPILDKKMLPY